MKRSFKFSIGVVAAVIAAMLTLAACSQPAKIKMSTALGNTAEAMMDKEYFTVTLKGEYTDGVTERAVKYTAVLSLLKTADGYDYRTEVTSTEDGNVTKRATVSVGGELYRAVADASGNFTEWAKVPADEQGDSSDSMLSNLSGDTLKSVIGGVDSSEMLTEKNGKYEIKATDDYGEKITGLKEFVLGGEGVQAGEYIAHWLNPDYTREQFVNDLSKIFKKKVKVLGVIYGIEDLLTHIGSDITVKDIVDGLCKKINITADDIYRVLKPQADEMLPDGLELMEPKNVTPYEYILSTGVGMLSVDTLFQKLGLGITTEQIGEKIMAAIDDDDITFGEIYDGIAEKFDPYLTSVLMLIGANEDAVAALRSKGAILGTENLKNYTVGKTAVSRNTVISAKDFSVLSLDLDTAADIAYGDNASALVKTHLTAHASFDYKTKVSVTAPAV